MSSPTPCIRNVPIKHKTLKATTPFSYIPSSTLYPEELSSVVYDQALGREAHLLQLLGIWCGDLSTSDTGGGCLQVVESVLASKCHDLRCDTERGETGLYAEHVAGLLDGLDDSLDVEGLDGAEVDDLSLNAVLGLELFGGDKGLADAAGEGDDGEVLAGALDLGLSELRGLSVSVRGGEGGGVAYRNDEVVLLGLLAHGEGKTVQKSAIVSNRAFHLMSIVTYSFSRTTTGLGSRMAAFNRPLASSALYGETTFSPGMLPYHAV